MLPLKRLDSLRNPFPPQKTGNAVLAISRMLKSSSLLSRADSTSSTASLTSQTSQDGDVTPTPQDAPRFFSKSPKQNGDSNSSTNRKLNEIIENDSESSTKPSFVTTIKDCQALSGDSARFDVTVSGSPTPKVTWFFAGSEVTTGSNVSVETSDDGRSLALVVRALTALDVGEYTCWAENAAGRAECRAELTLCRM